MLAVKKRIESLDYSRLIDLLYILINNGCSYSKNSNGIFFDINELDENSLDIIIAYIDEVESNQSYKHKHVIPPLYAIPNVLDISNVRTKHNNAKKSSKDNQLKRSQDDFKILLGSEYIQVFDILSQASSATHMEKEKTNFAGLVKKYSRKETRENP